MAGGQGWLIGFVGVAFGMGGEEWVVVGVDGWLLMMWVCLVVVGVAAGELVVGFLKKIGLI